MWHYSSEPHGVAVTFSFSCRTLLSVCLFLSISTCLSSGDIWWLTCSTVTNMPGRGTFRCTFRGATVHAGGRTVWRFQSSVPPSPYLCQRCVEASWRLKALLRFMPRTGAHVVTKHEDSKWCHCWFPFVCFHLKRETSKDRKERLWHKRGQDLSYAVRKMKKEVFFETMNNRCCLILLWSEKSTCCEVKSSA